ncbi:MAG TPA: biotin carboxylase N-terminal domain-containing protein, partial [Actinoplanes sp.]
MIRRLLVADRGEIARRVFATCRLVGIETVAVYSDADSDAPHIGEADYAVRLDGGPPAAAYLRGDLIITAAQRTGANAIHPGDGELAEDPDFAAAVVEAGMIWVGAPAKTLAMLRSKSETKAMVAEARVPVLPTYTDPDTVPGFPVLIKPDAGSGGTGLRVIRDAATLAEAVSATRRETGGAVYCEPYVENVRHIEVPVLADEHGAVVPFGERECSIQRRYQKIIEETPSPAVDPALREELCRAAIIAVRAIGFVGAGAVEFLLDAEGDFWFLELTPMVQAEHAVTECVSGYDLIRLQLLVAE